MIWSLVRDFDSWNHVTTERRFSGLGPDEGFGCAAAGSEEFCREFGYDSFERLASVRTLDSSNNVCTGSNCTATRTYDANGNVATVTEAGLNTYSYARDALNRVTQITLPTGKYSTLTYDIDDDVISRRDPKDAQNGGSGGTGRVATYLYDDFGNRIAMTSPDTGTFLYNYDAANEITQGQDADGNQMTYAYDLAGRIAAANSTAQNMSLAYLYDQTGTIDSADTYAYTTGKLTTLEARDQAGNRVFTHYSYDARGRPVLQAEERGPDSAPTFGDIRYTWGLNSELTGMTYPDGEQVTYQYPTSGGFSPVPLPSEVDAPFQGTQTAIAKSVGYATDGVIDTLSYGNGDQRTLWRNRRGEWTRLRSGPSTAPVLDQVYDYDGNGLGLLTEVYHFAYESESEQWQWNFTYDSLNRLTSYTTNVRPTSDTYTWTYDEVGNRKSETYNGTTTNYAYDTSGLTSQLMTLSGGAIDTWTYDAAGKVTDHYPYGAGKYPYAQYTYDARGRLNHVTAWDEPICCTAIVTDDSQRSYDGWGHLWQTNTGASLSNWNQNYYDIFGRLIEEYAYTGASLNNYPQYDLTDHVYLGEGAGEVGRVIRYYEVTCGSCGYSLVDDDIEYVHEDYRHGPFAIESKASNGLAWEVEENPFGEFMRTGAQNGPALPGPDGKIGTSDDLPAIIPNVIASMKSRLTEVDGVLTTQTGTESMFPNYGGRSGTPLSGQLFDPGGGSAYHPNAMPTTTSSAPWVAVSRREWAVTSARTVGWEAPRGCMA